MIKHVKLFESFSGIENKSRLSDKVTKLLNEQIKNELESSQIYRAMSCWLDEKGWIGAQKYFFNSAKEELKHMDKLYEYIFDRNAKAKTPNVGDVETDFKDIREIIEKSLDHEMNVTKNWEDIAEAALSSGDNTTYEFSQWYLKEQVEEESKFRDILFKLNLDMPKYELDELFEDLME